jgi:predicted nuclease of predicted toxin-antitoxin system
VKFIIDAQLPKSLAAFLKYKGLDAIHTLELPAKNETKDAQIIAFAGIENRIVITKDVDFLESFLIKALPKKLIIVRTGNIPNSQLIDLFAKNLDLITQLIQKSNLIEISSNEIIEHG